MNSQTRWQDNTHKKTDNKNKRKETLWVLMLFLIFYFYFLSRTKCSHNTEAWRKKIVLPISLKNGLTLLTHRHTILGVAICHTHVCTSATCVKTHKWRGFLHGFRNWCLTQDSTWAYRSVQAWVSLTLTPQHCLSCWRRIFWWRVNVSTETSWFVNSKRTFFCRKDRVSTETSCAAATVRSRKK